MAGLRYILATVLLDIKASIQSTDSLAVFFSGMMLVGSMLSEFSFSYPGLVEFWYFFQQ